MKKNKFQNRLDQDGDGLIDGPLPPNRHHSRYHDHYSRDPNGRFLPAYLDERFYFVAKPTRLFFFLLGAVSVLVTQLIIVLLIWWIF